MNELAGKTIDSIFWQRLAEIEPQTVVVRAGVSVTETGAYRVPVLGCPVMVDLNKKEVICPDAGCLLSLDYELILSTVLYLTGARQIPLSGRWIGPHQLSAGHFFRGHHAAPVGPIAERFGSDKNAFISRCIALGGKAEPLADAAFSFTLFPRIPMAVLLWLADDEFDARASFLIDDTADQHLKPDSILACMNLVQRALTREPA